MNVKRVEASELRMARAEAERMIESLGITYSSGDNVIKNRMEIFVRNKARVERKWRGVRAARARTSCKASTRRRRLGLAFAPGYPTTGRESSTPAGSSDIPPCSRRMAREMTRRCISLVPS